MQECRSLSEIFKFETRIFMKIVESTNQNIVVHLVSQIFQLMAVPIRGRKVKLAVLGNFEIISNC